MVKLQVSKKQVAIPVKIKVTRKPKLSEMSKNQLVTEAKRRKIYTTKCLKTSPSSATVEDLKRAIITHKAKLTRDRKKKLAMSAAGAVLFVGGVGVGSKYYAPSNKKLDSSETQSEIPTMKAPKIPKDPPSVIRKREEERIKKIVLAVNKTEREERDAEKIERMIARNEREVEKAEAKAKRERGAKYAKTIEQKKKRQLKEKVKAEEAALKKKRDRITREEAKANPIDLISAKTYTGSDTESIAKTYTGSDTKSIDQGSFMDDKISRFLSSGDDNRAKRRRKPSFSGDDWYK